MRIGLISDTHGFLDPKVFDYFAEVDQIWHAGDVGTVSIIEELGAFKPTLGVYGNIDGHDVRQLFPEDQKFDCEGVRVWMTHIGGKPPRYNPRVRPLINKWLPQLFICGHSHILAVMHDPKRPGILYMNPGAAGRHGFHKERTLLRFTIEMGKIKDLEVVKLGSRAQLL
ncbi:metallophosphatase family protein [Reichenbachiella carrageenanivorans]|uniref:Phosphoesterase n=1 Tax=Reichenbachiella carrageenanivorans TaxID=2979869 RepID=A0ABY6D4M4_9BACT|nr:metallophosphoesterase family protein [Reichenbachiella carrageenanivorans]UXX80844.1 metallophosphatase family protein [Reichenbachiella carrageenanivorans]